MAGVTNFPTALDDDSSLFNVTDNVTAVVAAHHNNLKEAMKAIEGKIGVFDTAVPTSIDYRLGHPTNGHVHDAASGQGPKISYNNLVDTPEVGAGGLWATHPAFGDRLAPLFPATHQHLGHPSSYSFMSMVPTYYLQGAAIRYIHPTQSDAHTELSMGRPTYSGVASYAEILVSAGLATESYLLIDNGGYVGLNGAVMMELVVNDYTRGGRYLAKHYLYGGWGLVLPPIATSAIHATYSEKGQMYFDDANNVIKAWTGATWRSVAFV